MKNLKGIVIAGLMLVSAFATAQVGATYNGKYHSKSKGLNWSLRAPLNGFKGQEAERPNIVRKWVKGSGTDSVLIMAMVKNLPTEVHGVSKSDWTQYLLNEGGVDDFAEGAREGFGRNPVLYKKSYTVLDNYPGVYVYGKGVHQRLNIVLDVYMAQYAVIVGNKMFILQLAANNKNKIYENIKLFRSVANTVIFPHQYGN